MANVIFRTLLRFWHVGDRSGNCPGDPRSATGASSCRTRSLSCPWLSSRHPEWGLTPRRGTLSIYSKERMQGLGARGAPTRVPEEGGLGEVALRTGLGVET